MKPVLMFAALLLPTVAQAHPGGHGGFNLGDLWVHFGSEPDHVAMILGVLAFGAALSWREWGRK